MEVSFLENIIWTRLELHLVSSQSALPGQKNSICRHRGSFTFFLRVSHEVNLTRDEDRVSNAVGDNAEMIISCCRRAMRDCRKSWTQNQRRIGKSSLKRFNNNYSGLCLEKSKYCLPLFHAFSFDTFFSETISTMFFLNLLFSLYNLSLILSLVKFYFICM